MVGRSPRCGMRKEGMVNTGSDLVGSILGQGVQVVHEHRLLQVLPHQLVKKMECLHVSRTDKASARHFKAVEGGLVGRDVSQKVRVFFVFSWCRASMLLMLGIVSS